MSLSVLLFALPSDVRTLNDSKIVTNTSAWLNKTYPAKKADKLAKIVSRICENSIDQDCGRDWFEAMLAIAKSNFEEVEFEQLQELRDSSIPEALGIVLPSIRQTAPFPVPRSNQHYPCIGFLSLEVLRNFQYQPGGRLAAEDRAEMEDELESLFVDLGLDDEEAESLSRLTRPVDEHFIKNLRDSFDYLRESIVDDGMGLLIFFM